MTQFPLSLKLGDHTRQICMDLRLGGQPRPKITDLLVSEADYLTLSASKGLT